MNRRAFFGGLAALSAARAVPPVDPLAWSGWKSPSNQSIELGWWQAADPRQDGWIIYATTLGVVGRVNQWGVLDTGLEDGWPLITAGTPDAVRESAKDRARVALLAELARG